MTLQERTSAETMTPAGKTDDLIAFAEKEYRIYFVNASLTGILALGHGKADMNERQAKIWARKIKEFGGKVPTATEVTRWGKFNGEGSL